MGQGAEDMRLIAAGVVLEDAKTLTELKIENDAVLALCYRKYGEFFFLSSPPFVWRVFRRGCYWGGARLTPPAAAALA